MLGTVFTKNIFQYFNLFYKNEFEKNELKIKELMSGTFKDQLNPEAPPSLLPFRKISDLSKFFKTLLNNIIDSFLTLKCYLIFLCLYLFHRNQQFGFWLCFTDVYSYTMCVICLQNCTFAFVNFIKLKLLIF